MRSCEELGLRCPAGSQKCLALPDAGYRRYQLRQET